MHRELWRSKKGSSQSLAEYQTLHALKKKKKHKKNLRPGEKQKKITGSFPPMNPDISQSSHKVPAGVERLHNSGGTR